MATITLADGNIDLDAALIAADLGLDSPEVLEAMRTRRLTATCERGVEGDAGRYRVTFYHGNTRLRPIVDAGGEIVERSLARLHAIRRMPSMRRLSERRLRRAVRAGKACRATPPFPDP